MLRSTAKGDILMVPTKVPPFDDVKIEASFKEKEMPVASVREDILETASLAVSVDRQNSYGDAKSNFYKIAQLWSAYLGAKIDEEDVAHMMTLLKIARTLQGSYTKDNYVDAAGYEAIAGEISPRRNMSVKTE